MKVFFSVKIKIFSYFAKNFSIQEEEDMQDDRANIIAKLRKDVLLQRFSDTRGKSPLYIACEPFAKAFHSKQFPLGVIHEFICPGEESFSASSAFISGILSPLMQSNGVAVWVSPSIKMFPPAFSLFGIKPERIIFITPGKSKDILWTTEEALKCKGITAVICDTPHLSFKHSRRLQLAAEESNVTGFILRNKPRLINTTACTTRWVIHPSISNKNEQLPGVGYPTWDVDLQKVKNGKPGAWKVSWHSGKFIHTRENIPAISIHQKKAV